MLKKTRTIYGTELSLDMQQNEIAGNGGGRTGREGACTNSSANNSSRVAEEQKAKA